MSIVMCLSRGVCVATLPSEVAADRSVGFVRFWLSITLNSERQQRPPLTIFSRNCRGLKTDGRIDELVDVLQQRRAFLACVQETWRCGFRVRVLTFTRCSHALR